MRPGDFPAEPPVLLTPLIGREQDISAVVGMLEQAEIRLLTLTGTGGIGKTSLARAIAVSKRMTERFGQRIAFVSLDSVRDPDLVLPAIAQAVSPLGGSFSSIRDGLLEALGDHPALLVLDNLEQVLEAGQEIAWLLGACQDVRVLATSRAPLRISAEHEYELQPLATPGADQRDPGELGGNPAVQLFLKRARQTVHGFVLTESNAPAVAEICRRLDGVPLAIELAAARIKVLPPAAMLSRLDAPLPLLTGGPADRPDRHQTLWSTIAWSYDLLSAGEQMLFRRLAVFTGSFSLLEAESIAGDLTGDTVDVIDGITRLVDHSLLRQFEHEGEPRFQMLMMLRAFGLDQADVAGETDALRARHADLFIELADAASFRLRGAERFSWLERLEAAHDNLRAGLSWAYDRGDTARAVRLAGALWQFWWWRSHLVEGRHRLEQVAAMPGADSQGAYWARLLTGCGALAETVGDYARSAAYHDRAVTVWEELGETRGLAVSYLFRWLVAFNADDQQRMHELSSRSLELFQQLGDDWGVAMSLMEQGVEAMRHEDAALADRVLAEGIERFTRIGDSWGVAICQGVAGNVATSRRQYDVAARVLNESLTTLLNRDDLWGVATVLPAVARLSAEQGDFARAVRLSGAVQRMHEKMGALLKAPFRERYERNLAAARTKLGEERFKSLLAEGHAMSPAEAVRLATQPISSGSSEAPAAPAQKLLSLLSPREREVLRYVARGMSAKEIGEALFISVATVRTHSENIRNKFALDNERALIAFIYENKLV